MPDSKLLENMHGIDLTKFRLTGEIKARDIFKITESNKKIIKTQKNIWEFYNTNFKVKFKEEEFLQFYHEDDFTDRQCYYCKITEKMIEELGDSFKLNKDFMIYPRGQHMEVDRKKPSDDYRYHPEKECLVLACYWCNNAKTDEFTAEEFKPIGDAIWRVWVSRK